MTHPSYLSLSVCRLQMSLQVNEPLFFFFFLFLISYRYKRILNLNFFAKLSFLIMTNNNLLKKKSLSNSKAFLLGTFYLLVRKVLKPNCIVNFKEITTGNMWDFFRNGNQIKWKLKWGNMPSIADNDINL